MPKMTKRDNKIKTEKYYPLMWTCIDTTTNISLTPLHATHLQL